MPTGRRPETVGNAVERLARRFVDSLEHMDPEGSGWDALTDDDRELYKDVFLEVLDDEGLVLGALKEARRQPRS